MQIFALDNLDDVPEAKADISLFYYDRLLNNKVHELGFEGGVLIKCRLVNPPLPLWVDE